MRQILTDEEKIFFKGYLNLPLPNSDYLGEFKDNIRHLWSYKNNQIFWKNEGPTYDLLNYDEKTKEILNNLFLTSEISNKVSDILGHEYFLGGYLVRMLMPGKTYFGWHRDFYKYSNAITIGPFPPTIKCIFTPNLFEKKIFKVFKYAIGTNRSYSSSNLFDTKILPFFSKKYIHSMNDKRMLLFDGFGLHSPIKNYSRDPMLRLIISFHPRYKSSKFKEYLKTKNQYLPWSD